MVLWILLFIYLFSIILGYICWIIRFGMVFSLKDLAMKLSPTNSTDGLHTLKTNSFTLHHFQTLSGLVFVINSSPDVQGVSFWIYFLLSNLIIIYSFSTLVDVVLLLFRSARYFGADILANIRGLYRAQSTVPPRARWADRVAALYIQSGGVSTKPKFIEIINQYYSSLYYMLLVPLFVWA